MNDIGPTLLTGFGLLALWIITYFGWRPYRIDKVRNELFALRNELFDFAAGGGVSLGDTAYRMLRDRVNALIRYAHIITVTRLLIFMGANRYFHSELAESRHQKYLAEVSRLPESAQAKLRDIDDRVAKILARKLVIGSPLLLIVIAVYLFPVIVRKLLRIAPHEDTRLRVARELHVELIEEQAVLAQTQQRDRDLSGELAAV